MSNDDQDQLDSTPLELWALEKYAAEATKWGKPEIRVKAKLITALFASVIEARKDAARYRFLMRQMPCNIADLFDGPMSPDEVDDEIDEQIVKEAGDVCKSS